MQAFAYANPTTVKEAVGLLGNKWGEADVLAGGTDLLNLMKEYIHAPQRVVNIKSIKDLNGVMRTGAGLRIGATTTIDELMGSMIVKDEYPSLYQAAEGITSPQLRNMGTVGGDLCQRPRCWYFRNGYGVLAMGTDGKALVPTGENKYHAIFSEGPAHFVSASSFGPALVALGAKVKLVSASGEREVPVSKFFVAPTTASAREIALLPNEILTEIIIPGTRDVAQATYEVRHRDAIADWPLATASVAMMMDGKTVKSAKVVLGHVAPMPWPAMKADAVLTGKSVRASLFEEAAAAAVDGAKPLSQNAYKVHLAKVAVKRALMRASGLEA